MPLSVGVDARAATETAAGRGRHLRGLLRHMAELEEPIQLRPFGRSRPGPGELGSDLGAELEWRVIRAPGPLWPLVAGRRGGRNCDVVLAAGSYLMTAATRVPCVPIVYDLVPFRGELHPPRGSLAERATLPLAVRRAAALVASSQSTRDELVARFPIAAGKVSIIYPAADDTFQPNGSESEATLRRYGIEQPYVLFTGTLEPRKNLPRLIDAFAMLPDELRDSHRLVIVGLRGWETAEIDSALARLGQQVITPGFVPDADLVNLYRAATLFCYPSLHEGFGLPVLEAMQCGTPVLTSNVSSLPEVGGDAAAYVDPRDTDAMRQALERLLQDEDERARLAARGPQQASRFSWQRSAQELVHVLREAAGQ
jgi:glycosyltransferase involved in cell wall biosynthesis